MQLHIKEGASGLAAAKLLASLAPSDCAPIAVFAEYNMVLVPSPEPAIGADERRCGVLVFACDGINQYAIIVIPGIKNECISAVGANMLDIEHSGIAALIAELMSGKYRNKYGYALIACKYAGLEIREKIYDTRIS
jgi:hypothetical protein